MGNENMQSHASLEQMADKARRDFTVEALKWLSFGAGLGIIGIGSKIVQDFFPNDAVYDADGSELRQLLSGPVEESEVREMINIYTRQRLDEYRKAIILLDHAMDRNRSDIGRQLMRHSVKQVMFNIRKIEFVESLYRERVGLAPLAPIVIPEMNKTQVVKN